MVEISGPVRSQFSDPFTGLCSGDPDTCGVHEWAWHSYRNFHLRGLRYFGSKVLMAGQVPHQKPGS